MFDVFSPEYVNGTCFTKIFGLGLRVQVIELEINC